jgi:hypothetical protein
MKILFLVSVALIRMIIQQTGRDDYGMNVPGDATSRGYIVSGTFRPWDTEHTGNEKLKNINRGLNDIVPIAFKNLLRTVTEP